MPEAQIASMTALDATLLQSLFLFEALPVRCLESFAAKGALVECDAGLLFREGDRAQHFYVLVEGELRLSKRSGMRDVETTRTAHRGAYCGATASFIDNPPGAYGFTVRTLRPTTLVRLEAEFIGNFVRTQSPMAVHLLQGMHVDHENVHQIIDQQRRLRAVGTLTAGLMHGLNNPAAAIARISAELADERRTTRSAGVYKRLSPSAAAVFDLFRHEGIAVATTSEPSASSSLAHIDAEDQIDDWLNANGLAGNWELAPVLATAGLTVTWLQRVAEALTREDLGPVLAAICDAIEDTLLLKELAAASAEVSALVASAQRYSQLDTSPMTYCNVNDLVASTLAVLSPTFNGEIAVHCDYADGLPELLCYAGELNQTWTNIIDNATYAIRATGTHGIISVRTHVADGEVVTVDIADTGTGIDPAIRDRIFLPFFTTKPVGEGTGMGLDMAWRTITGLHRGSLSVTSVPGNTCFTVRLPLTTED